MPNHSVARFPGVESSTVISGPVAVVVASLISAYIAIVGQDPVLLKDEVAVEQQGKTEPDALTPAVQARNHAQTPAR